MKKKFLIGLEAMLFVAAVFVFTSAVGWINGKPGRRLERMLNEWRYRYPENRVPFRVWAPCGFDVRTAREDTTSLPPDGKRLEYDRDSILVVFRNENPPVVNQWEVELVQWVANNVSTAAASGRVLGMVVSAADFPDNEREARRMFKIYERQIARQLSKEQTPEDWMGNDSWNSVEHQSWRIISGGEFFWFRLDLYETKGHWSLHLHISNATVADEIGRKMAEERRKRKVE